MRPYKAALFLIYCLLGLAAFGTAFSHLWRTNKLLENEERYVAQYQNRLAPPPAAQPAS